MTCTITKRCEVRKIVLTILRNGLGEPAINEETDLVTGIGLEEQLVEFLYDDVKEAITKKGCPMICPSDFKAQIAKGKTVSVLVDAIWKKVNEAN